MKNISRRKFLSATTVVALPYFIPSHVFGKNSPSKQITIGFIGTGEHVSGTMASACTGEIFWVRISSRGFTPSTNSITRK